MTYTYDPHFTGQGRTIAVVGCGGTGAHVARLIARIIFDMKRRHMQSIPDLLLIDPDKVEPKNIGRQLFSHAEVGEYKAITIMRRLNAALNISCTALPEAVKPGMLSDAKIIVGCVDNHMARQTIAASVDKSTHYHEWTPTVWIDAGNHRTNGQVIIGNTNHLRNVKPDKNGKYPHLPMPSLLFPALLEPDPETDTKGLSCAELLELGEQDLLVNDWMGIVAAQYVKQLLYMQPITTFLTWVAPDYLSTTSVPISPENLAAYLPKE